MGAAVRELAGWEARSAGELAEAVAGWGAVPEEGGAVYAGEGVRAAAESAGGASSSPASHPASLASPSPAAPSQHPAQQEAQPVLSGEGGGEPAAARGLQPVLLSSAEGEGRAELQPVLLPSADAASGASGDSGGGRGELQPPVLLSSADAAPGGGREELQPVLLSSDSGGGRDAAAGDGREELQRVLEALLDAHLAAHALSQVDPAPCTLRPAPCTLVASSCFTRALPGIPYGPHTRSG